MADGPRIAAVARLIGDPARAEMLSALLGGQALTASELGDCAAVGKATASAHLSRLVEARLLEVEAQGRHRYFRLADKDVADLLESLMGVAQRTGATRLRTGPREPALRHARVCYDHLAGELGVHAFDAFESKGWLVRDRQGLRVTDKGMAGFERAGLVPDDPGRRPICRGCLDWSERRTHLAGVVGARMLERCYERGWAKRERASRVVTFSAPGERAFREWLRRPS